MKEQRRFCPLNVFKKVRLTLIERLEQALLELGVPRLSLAFFDGEGNFDPGRVLHTDPDLKFRKTSVYEGLLGLTIRRGEIVIYPYSMDSKENYLKVDPRTNFEIAGPVLFQNSACAALFADMFDEDLKDLMDPELLRRKFRSILDSLSDLIDESRKEILSEFIQTEMEKLLSQTNSLRGYVAIRDWDSSLISIKVGVNPDIFLDLSETEGVCGYVIQTGLPINIKNTKTPPKLIHNGEPYFRYISSDTKIKSEYVAPFVHENTVIGILNLEAIHVNNFREHRRNAIKQVRDQLLDSVQKFRRPLDVNLLGAEFVVGRAIQDLSEQLEHKSMQKRSRIVVDSAQRMAEGLKQVFPEGLVHGPFINKKQLSESQFGDLDWDSRHNYGQWEQDGTWFCPCEALSSGIRQAVAIIEHDSPISSNAISAVGRLGRLAALRMSASKRRLSQVAKDQIISGLIDGDVEDLMAMLPELACGVWDCDHATVFAAVAVRANKTRLFPFSSTAHSLTYVTNERSYAIDVRDGLTGYSATKKEPFVISRFSSNEDLEYLGKVPRFRAKIVEMSSSLPQSFAGIPLLNRGKLVYLLRLSKILGNRAAGFSEEDYETMTLIQSLFELRLDSNKEKHNDAPLSEIEGVAASLARSEAT